MVSEVDKYVEEKWDNSSILKKSWYLISGIFGLMFSVLLGVLLLGILPQILITIGDLYINIQAILADILEFLAILIVPMILIVMGLIALSFFSYVSILIGIHLEYYIKKIRHKIRI